MNKLVIGSISVVVLIGIMVPAIKGPFNRWRLEANEKLNAEYVVDNYKAEYVKLYDSKNKVQESINKFNVEKAVVTKKLSLATNKTEVARKTLIATGTSDLNAFNRARDIYETAKVEQENFETMVNAYSQAIKKLEYSLAMINSNMTKAKLNVNILSSKKTMLDTIQNVNKSIENLNGVGDIELAVNIEKLDDDMLRESVKLEALDNAKKPMFTTSEAEAKAYIDSLNY